MREVKLKIDSALTVVRAIFFCDFEFMHFFVRQAECFAPFVYCNTPLLKFSLPLSAVHKIFDFHLLKLTGTKNKIPWAYLVTESFTLLRQTKRHVRVKTIDNILEVRKNTLGGFGSKISPAPLIINHNAVSKIALFYS